MRPPDPKRPQVPELDVNNPEYTIPCFEKKLFSMITDEVCAQFFIGWGLALAVLACLGPIHPLAATS